MTSPLPALEALLIAPACEVLLARFGRVATVAALREELARLRAARRFPVAADTILDLAADILARRFAPVQRRVFNLTGTILHTNLGRAPLPQEAAAAAAEALAHPTSVEFDLATGRRGERDAPISELLRTLTGGEAATVVNNNAAAVLLVLNTLALGREVPVSRGELVEIGGSFRVPEIMSRAGAKLVEVGTTNRTHPRDYLDAINQETALVMRVHPSNYAVTGFTAAVPLAELAGIAREAGLPLVEDLGSGSLIDLATLGLPHEPTPRESLAAGVDLVTFSGDKLLGGPQAGLVVGQADLIARLNANPLKRALRLDKGRLAALEAVLRLYLMPEQLSGRLPTLRLLTRPASDIQAAAERIAPALQTALPDHPVAVTPCRSQIGSGARPLDLLDSAAITLGGDRLDGLAARLRALPIPVIGRIGAGRLWLDCRCLDAAEEPDFVAQISSLL
jgi:L-seryl-tRNA(Ser) seleniumtransferase